MAAIRAAWLEGSFGRGNADRYSDLDIHLLLVPEHWQTFQAEVKSWLSPIRPLVLFNLLFDGKMVNALTADGITPIASRLLPDSSTLHLSQRLDVPRGTI